MKLKRLKSIIPWILIIGLFFVFGAGGILVGFLLSPLLLGIIEVFIKIYVWIYSYKFKRRFKKSMKREFKFDDTPDEPVPFGAKTHWIAVRTENYQEVARHMNLLNIQPANWSTGSTAALEGIGYYFVSPPVNGWTMVLSSSLPVISDDEGVAPQTDLIQLSAIHGEACYFGTHRTVDYYAWAKAVGGKLKRVYCYSDEGIFQHGEETAEEIGQNLIFSTEVHTDIPSEEDVLFISREWSIDTIHLDEMPKGVGLIGERKFRGN